MPYEHGRRNGITTSPPSLGQQTWVLEDELGAQLLMRGAHGIELTLARRYVKLGFGGAHTDSNQRLMYTSA